MHHLVGAAEIATMMGVSKERVRQLMEGFADFPRPEVELTAGRIWSRTAIEEWITTHRVQRPDGEAEVGLFKRFTPDAVAVITASREDALALSHDAIGPEHLLVALRAQGDLTIAGRALAGPAGVPLDEYRATLRGVAGTGTKQTDPNAKLPFTSAAQRALKMAMHEASALGSPPVGPEHLLLGILSDTDRIAANLLEALSIRPTTLRQTILRMIQEADQERAIARALAPIVEQLNRIEQRLDNQPQRDM